MNGSFRIEREVVNPRTWLLGWARRCRVIGFSIAGCLLLATSAWAAQVIFNVDSTRDEIDDNTAIATCHTALGTCTLRAAVMQANHIVNADTLIKLPAGIYTLGPAVDADGDDSGDLNLTAPGGSPIVTIAGAGAATTIIDGNFTDRILSIAAGREAHISGVTIRNGKAAGNGGGIYNAGNLLLSNCGLDHNSANTFGYGGGVYNSGHASITNTTLSINEAGSGGGAYNTGTMEFDHSTLHANIAGSIGGGAVNLAGLVVSDSTLVANSASVGGGIYSASTLTSDATLDVTRSTISNNTAATGGGIFNSGNEQASNDSVLFATNSTISQNQATANGGGIFNAGTANVYSVAIVYNEADADSDDTGSGAGVYNEPAAVFNMRNSVVAGSYLGGYPVYSDCDGVLGFYGNNRLGYADACSVAAGSTGAVYLVDSLNELAALKDNGGPTKTVALVPPSNLIDAGVLDGGCVDQNGNPLTTDQRGRPRIIGSYCDIGAFEYDPGDIFANGFQ
jgi:hypothetical protein